MRVKMTAPVPFRKILEKGKKRAGSLGGNCGHELAWVLTNSSRGGLRVGRCEAPGQPRVEKIPLGIFPSGIFCGDDYLSHEMRVYTGCDMSSFTISSCYRLWVIDSDWCWIFLGSVCVSFFGYNAGEF